MKLDRLIWGILLLFIGGVLLLENFGVINFYWSNVWRFWPVFLIIGGVNLLFNKGESKKGHAISLVILVCALAFLFFRGQQPRGSFFWHNEPPRVFFKEEFDMPDTDDEHNDNEVDKSNAVMSIPFSDVDTLKKAVLEISGGGVAFKTNGSTEEFVKADVENNRAGFYLNKRDTDSATVLSLKMGGKKNKFNFDGDNDVKFELNPAPVWDLKMNLGAGAADLDFSDFKIRSFRFDGGAADVDLKVGALLPISDVVVKSGLADVKINIPSSVGCRIKTKTGLSSKDFDGFNKISEGVYESVNYKTSTKKVFIYLDGGLSNFEVNRYE
ncbi:LiaF transmembrane domain-containing protein [Pedobacter sp. MW01-1-1]|uniref:LiaF transmembrane domain-containing protein n=1 Tax=Pedobacter sp. MW01-1-1 TaxID=3383027 RepID=UPI003FED923F